MGEPRPAGDDRRRALRGALRALELGLAAGGLACLLAYGGACARASLTQSTSSADFDAALAEQLERLERIHAETPDLSEWSSIRVAKYEASLEASVQALGRLEIPEAGVSVMVLEGTEETTLDRAVGRIEGTAQPGDPGNVGIAGHRDGFFRGLRHVEPGDEITLTTLDGVARYRVETTLVVSPDDVEVLEQTSEPTLTLVTCYPFYYVGSAPKRYIVQARRVSYEGWRVSEST